MDNQNDTSGFDDPSLIVSANPDPAYLAGISTSSSNTSTPYTTHTTVAGHITKAIHGLQEFPNNADPNYHDTLRHLRAAADSLDKFFSSGS